MARKKASSATGAKIRQTPPKRRPAASAAESTKQRSKKKVKAARQRKPATRKAGVKQKSLPVSKVMRRKPVSIGRPRIAADANLEEMFRKDYEARQVFEFLDVKTVRELEVYRSSEIVTLLTQPIVQTVDRIRKALALNNRHLAGDRQFAIQFKRQLS